MSKDANKGEEVQVGCCYGVTVFTKDMKALSDVRCLGLTSQKEGRMITNPNVNLNTRSDDVVDHRRVFPKTLEDQLANSARANGVPMVVASSYTVGISYSTDSMCEKGQAPYCAFGFQVQTTKNADQPTEQQTTKPGPDARTANLEKLKSSTAALSAMQKKAKAEQQQQQKTVDAVNAAAGAPVPPTAPESLAEKKAAAEKERELKVRRQLKELKEQYGVDLDLDLGTPTVTVESVTNFWKSYGSKANEIASWNTIGGMWHTAGNHLNYMRFRAPEKLRDLVEAAMSGGKGS